MKQPLDLANPTEDLRNGVIIGYARGRTGQVFSTPEFSHLSEEQRIRLEDEFALEIYYASMAIKEQSVIKTIERLDAIPTSEFLSKLSRYTAPTSTETEVRSPEQLRRSLELVEHTLLEGISSIAGGSRSTRKFELLEAKFSELGLLRWALGGDFDKSFTYTGITFTSMNDVREHLTNSEES